LSKVEIINELKEIIERLKKIVDSLEKLTVEEVIIPLDLRDDVEVTHAEDMIIIKPKHFLGDEKFKRLAKIVKAKGGYYVSNKEKSRFEIKVSK
jgi:hypothetical protein